MTTALVTTVTKSYIPFARVAMASAASHHPESLRFVLVLDGGPEVADCIPGATVLRPSDVIKDPHELLVQQCIYKPIEFATALKPRLLLHLLKIADRAIFIDPDMRLFQPLDSALAKMDAGCVALLTPHRLTPPRFEDRGLYEWLFKAYGTYNTAFVGVTQDSSQMLEWWDSRLRRDCLADLSKVEWVDQKIMDLSPGYYDIRILRDAGYNVCWWNLEERPLNKRSQTWFAGESPLVLMHYSGVRPSSRNGSDTSVVDLPYLVHSPKNSVINDSDHMGAIRELEAEYIQDINVAGYADFTSTKYGFASTPGGRRLSISDRRGYRALVLEAEARGDVAPHPDDIDWNVSSRLKRVALSMTFPGALLRDVRQKAWKTRS